MRTPRQLPLRLRVALAFTLTAALALVALGVFLHLRVGATLESQVRDGVAARLDALERLPAEDQVVAVREMAGASFAQVLGPDGEVLATSPQLRGPVLSPGERPGAGSGAVLEREVFLTTEGERAPALVEVRSIDGRSLLLGESLEDVQDALEGVTTQLLVGGPLALLLASGLGYLVAGSALRPMERMRARAVTISARSSGDRLPVPAVRDEVHRLGTTLNGMLDRLDDGLRRERRFVADASHELRTPLALLHTELDLARARPRTAEEIDAALASAVEEVERLSALVDHLLLLASADDSGLRLQREPVSVTGLLSDVARRFATLDPERRVTVTDGPPVEVGADRSRLDQAVSNLVDNALRHGSGEVTLAVARVGDGVEITVADEGGAALDADLFERFARGEAARSGGRGLGLAIVRAIVTEHGGSVRAEVRGGATTVVVELPA